MKCCDILNFYKRGDLNRLAKNKIANYAGLPVEILRDELSKDLTAYDYVKRKRNVSDLMGLKKKLICYDFDLGISSKTSIIEKGRELDWRKDCMAIDGLFMGFT